MHNNFFSSSKRRSGFTLVELLVVIAIIAILATIGFTVFSGTRAKARDAKRKADIGQIASAYEVNYNQNTGAYAALADGQFTAGDTPSPPESPTGTYTYSVGPNAASPSTATYTVCATLEGGTAGCTVPSATCFCRSAAQAGTTTAAATPAPSCTVTSAYCYSTSYLGTAITTIYVTCPTGVTTFNCSSGTPTTVPYWTVASGGTQAGTISLGPYDWYTGRYYGLTVRQHN